MAWPEVGPPPQPDSPPFRLFDLPAELRGHILAFVVADEHPIVKPRIFIPRDGFYLRLPAITKVNRQLRAESLPLYYEENVFLLDIADVLDASPGEGRDVRWERKLLSFGAWCDAAGDAGVARIRNFIFSQTPRHGLVWEMDLHVLLRLLPQGRFELTVHPYTWCIPAALGADAGPGRGRGGRRRANPCPGPRCGVPEAVAATVREGLRRNGDRGLLREDVGRTCQSIRDHLDEVLLARHAPDWNIVRSICTSLAT